MPYKLKYEESKVYGHKKFANTKGNTECVEFVRQAAGAPETKFWKQGIKVLDSAASIEKYTAIATFVNAQYPTDALGQHAAIYLSHDDDGIEVLDQWNSQAEVKKRKIRSKRPEGTRRSNDAKWFYVIA